MYKEDLALNNLQWLICHKTQLNQIIYILYICIKCLPLCRGAVSVFYSPSQLGNTNRDISNKYILTVRNKFESLQETFKKDSPNEEYEKIYCSRRSSSSRVQSNQTSIVMRITSSSE